MAVLAARRSPVYCKNLVPAERGRRGKTRSSTRTRASLFLLVFLRVSEQTLTSHTPSLPSSLLDIICTPHPSTLCAPAHPAVASSSPSRLRSWNNNASIIFLDQPVGVGYSYADKHDEGVWTTEAAARDVRRARLAHAHGGRADSSPSTRRRSTPSSRSSSTSTQTSSATRASRSPSCRRPLERRLTFLFGPAASSTSPASRTAGGTSPSSPTTSASRMSMPTSAAWPRSTSPRSSSATACASPPALRLRAGGSS